MAPVAAEGEALPGTGAGAAAANASASPRQDGGQRRREGGESPTSGGRELLGGVWVPLPPRLTCQGAENRLWCHPALWGQRGKSLAQTGVRHGEGHPFLPHAPRSGHKL